uniref:Putative secreted protein n=1 Tax=Anopheles darlingi TaxID=43151 RepID=A0A2M4D0E9_ANODA
MRYLPFTITFQLTSWPPGICADCAGSCSVSRASSTVCTRSAGRAWRATVRPASVTSRPYSGVTSTTTPASTAGSLTP